MTVVMEIAFQHLNSQIHNINASGPVSAAIDPIKREIRKHKVSVETGTESARLQEEIAATYIEQGRFGDALTAINEGLIGLCQLKKPFIDIRDRLNKISAKGHTIVTDSLQQLGFDKEIEAWDSSVHEWTGRMAMPTWKV